MLAHLVGQFLPAAADIGIDRIDFRTVGSHTGRLAHSADAAVPQSGLEQLSDTRERVGTWERAP